jgi:hypothetical protein
MEPDMIRAEELVEIALASMDFAEFQTRLGILKRWQELERYRGQIR